MAIGVKYNCLDFGCELCRPPITRISGVDILEDGGALVRINSRNYLISRNEIEEVGTMPSNVFKATDVVVECTPTHISLNTQYGVLLFIGATVRYCPDVLPMNQPDRKEDSYGRGKRSQENLRYSGY